ncbi:MAG: hypothetical protein HYX27_02790 [Acidobacteria bacterium]|nr:hypothetical protein [Acidobacteriota bacterium]
MSALRLLAALLCLSAAASPGWQIATLSGRPDKVSGGETLVRVEVPANSPLTGISIRRNGQDVTASFRPEHPRHALLGLVRGLRIGQNTLEVFQGPGPADAQLSIVNFPSTGPIFSGPREQPFICQSHNFLLPDATHLGPALDADCTVKTVVTYVYKTEQNPALKPLPQGAPRPADVAFTTTTTGQRVPYIVRVETGTLNRSIYQFAVLHDPTADPLPSPHSPPKSWNRRLLYTFGGGCTGGWFRQGGALPGVVNDDIVGKGYAEASATLNVFGNNCQDVVAAETMMMVKERLIEAYGPPAFTFGRGGSGGSYQQIQIADGYPGLLDGIIPSATFPDVLETTQFLTDAQLLDNYFAKSGSSLNDEQKRAIAGVGTLKNITGTANGAGRINPTTFCPPELPIELRYHPLLNRSGARCDIFDHTVNVYGRDPATGFARRAIDNAGVQYGLTALNSGAITPAQFLDLNEKIGGYDNDGTLAPARSVADPQALRAAYQTGRVTFGGNGLSRIPIIDYRAYTDLTINGDVHQKYHSYSFRERLRAANGTAANEVVLLAAQRSPRVHAFAIAKMDEWLTNLAKDTSNAPILERITRAKPVDLSDSCYSANETRILEPQTFSGGECNKLYQTFPPPRMIAGGPITNNVLKCQLKPIDPTDYAVPFSDTDKQRLRRIFPTGVCDWKKPGVEQQRPVGTWLQY